MKNQEKLLGYGFTHETTLGRVGRLGFVNDVDNDVDTAGDSSPDFGMSLDL